MTHSTPALDHPDHGQFRISPHALMIIAFLRRVPPGDPPSSKPGDPISAYDNLARPTITHLIRHLDSTGHRYQHVHHTLRRWVILFINPQVPVVCDWMIQSLPADQSYHVPLCPRPPLDRLVPRTAIPILPLSRGAPVQLAHYPRMVLPEILTMPCPAKVSFHAQILTSCGNPGLLR
jgi:hypothetical protein